MMSPIFEDDFGEEDDDIPPAGNDVIFADADFWFAALAPVAAALPAAEDAPVILLPLFETRSLIRKTCGPDVDAGFEKNAADAFAEAAVAAGLIAEPAT
jgi:hypothetical protein